MCLPKLKIYIENIVEKGRNCSLGAIPPLAHNILLPDVRFLRLRTRFSLRNRWLFEITEVEIKSVDCTYRIFCANFSKNGDIHKKSLKLH